MNVQQAILVTIFCSSAAGDQSFIDMVKSSKQKKLPPMENGSPLMVHIGFYVESIGSIKATEMAFDMDMYLRMSWRDSRLSHTEPVLVINDMETLNKMWIPDIFFANAKQAQFQHVTVPNFVIFVEKDGTCAYSTRVTMNVACNLDFREYPLDRQTCMNLFFDAHTRNEMNVSWFDETPINKNPSIDLPEFSIRGTKPEYCNGYFKYAITPNGYRNGEFSCLTAVFYLERSLGYHLVQTYIPTALIVIISWVSFWIDRNAVPARVSLSFTTLLTLSTMGAGLRYSLPAVSYAKAIDFWFGTCMFFIFGALLEFALVNSFTRRSQKFENLLNARKNKDKAGATPNEHQDWSASTPMIPLAGRIGKEIDEEELKKMQMAYGRKALMVDQTCRLLFPILFMIFNIVYWVIYTKF